MKKTFIYIAAFMLLSLVSGYVTYKFLNTGRNVTVPELRGKTLKEAEEIARKEGIALIPAEEYDHSLPAGRVVGQELQAGETIKSGSDLRVIVSKGPSARRIPSVLGLTAPEAKAMFLQAGLEVKNIMDAHSDSVGQGRVIAQSPQPGEVSGGEPSLIVSAGHFDIIYYVPDFTGMALQNAVSLARELGLNTVVSGDGDSIVSHRPQAGSLIRPGETVYLDL